MTVARMLKRQMLRGYATQCRRLVPLYKCVDARPAASHTVYLQGFLTHGSSADDWEGWTDSHIRTVKANQSWSGAAVGFAWQTGAEGDVLGRYPLPLATLPVSAWYLTIAPTTTVVAAVASDAVASALRLVRQFRLAEASACQHAAQLAEELSALPQPYRVVAHSLGCRLAVEAVSMLAVHERPVELHLCAAAMAESVVGDKIRAIAQQEDSHIYNYFSRRDEVLRIAFRLTNGEDAIGSVGLSADYGDSVTNADVTRLFGVPTHNSYRHRFDALQRTGLTLREQRRLTQQQPSVQEQDEAAEEAAEALREPRAAMAAGGAATEAEAAAAATLGGAAAAGMGARASRLLERVALPFGVGSLGAPFLQLNAHATRLARLAASRSGEAQSAVAAAAERASRMAVGAAVQARRRGDAAWRAGAAAAQEGDIAADAVARSTAIAEARSAAASSTASRRGDCDGAASASMRPLALLAASRRRWGARLFA
uniref:DUF726 domain-containing protein n=4 Tax=Chrysotila carterae TaxID=13221 RepID=A0A7S4EXH7_CHRCT